MDQREMELMSTEMLPEIAAVPMAVLPGAEPVIAPPLPAVPPRKLAILGTRGIPACHGGFESFAERLALYLVERDWDITVYCQQGVGATAGEEYWQGVRLVHVPVSQKDALGTIVFDLKSTLAAARDGGTILTLGYNTAIFCLRYRLQGITNYINMDGLEWMREKWSRGAKAWLWTNEWFASRLGNHLIADHPCIAQRFIDRVGKQKVTMIPYGADRVDSADERLLEPWGLSPREYVVVIARPEPENSIRQIVSAFSRRSRGCKLVVLGKFDYARNAYHRAVRDAAGPEVMFPGAIYDRQVVAALRYHSLFYVHGHQVGGTNPALVEALGAGAAVVAHDNQFNRWVAGPGASYFATEDALASEMDRLLSDPFELERMRAASVQRFSEGFAWNQVLGQYERLLGLGCLA